ncbi:YceI family protein [Luminiphilus sp.]|nr:YceI family protein [Luminiphilus sp.]MDA9666581.1 YceI family protein [Luminiphilus sp.]
MRCNIRKISWMILLLISFPAWSSWEVAGGSVVHFISIKNNAVGELSQFESVVGTVSDEGQVDIRVALNAVETNVGIRNDRMKELLFEVGLFPEAKITAQLAPSVVSATQGQTVETTLAIDLHGQVVNRTATLQVAPNEQGLSVVSAEPILLTASEFGLESGVAALQRIAGLDAISRVIPVTVRLQLVRQ